jgi:nicotinate-nucleotide pyrophosphorylase (carboxylating)
MFLIKENHLAASGGIEVAVKRCREYVENLERNFLIEVETRNLQEVEQALNAGADRIMLDNMNLEQIKAAVELVNHRVPLEVSGNVNLQSVAAIAATGVEFISTGAITHSAPAMDFSMLFEETVKKDPANENI